LADVLHGEGWEVKHLPPLSFDQTKEHGHPALPNAKNCARVGEASRIIKEHVSAACEPDTFPLILGGDHCVAIGTISGIKEKRPNNAIVWVCF
jgi:arginase